MIYRIVWQEAHIVTVEAKNEAEAKKKLKENKIIKESKERIGDFDIYSDEDL